MTNARENKKYLICKTGGLSVVSELRRNPSHLCDTLDFQSPLSHNLTFDLQSL